jgi:hypothetical protein
VDDDGVGVDRSEGADADGHHRGAVLPDGFADLAEHGGDDLIGTAGPGVATARRVSICPVGSKMAVRVWVPPRSTTT